MNHQKECMLGSAMEFAPLTLSEDDRLPTDMELVMGYDGLLSPDAVAAAMLRGLKSFPHLTGKIIRDPASAIEQIVPTSGTMRLEVVETMGPASIAGWQGMALAEQSKAFIPGALDAAVAGSLWQARLTLFPDAGRSVIGLRVSHATVDGSGLAWFIHQCTAEFRGADPCIVFHERIHGFGQKLDGPDDSPHGYREANSRAASVWEDDALARATPRVFTLPVSRIMARFGASSWIDGRLRLSAWLCLAVARMVPQIEEVGLWCDARGTNGIPASYTGNTGCFLHFPLRGTSDHDLARALRNVASRRGYARIADTYRRIKLAESRGHPLVWEGIEKNVLQLNLVPHAVAVTDFGKGLPTYALLLSRNSSGLRIALAPDTEHLIIEACLPDAVGQGLVEECRQAGLAPVSWCAGS